MSGIGTPLDELGLSSEEQTFFASRWITSVEELVAASAAVQAGSSPNSRAATSHVSFRQAFAAARSRLPETTLTKLTEARQGGACGYLVDQEHIQEFKRSGRVRPVSLRPTAAFQKALPSAVRLMDLLPPVKDQGQRGTCVAFASVALREYLLGCRECLSEQFLYWACKELDGIDGEGTRVSTAMSALAEYGVCRGRDWPYHPYPTWNQGQGPPPWGAVDLAREFQLSSARTVEANLVLHYKSVLAGESGAGRMPVTFATLVFSSWAQNPETYRTGKIFLPLPGEEPEGGHAWCVVGFVDHAAVPGGGYFVVRNSWSNRWAAESPERPGHAMMPYEYVERFAMEAFTAPLEIWQGKPASGRVSVPLADERRPYVRELKADDRDLDGRLVPAGSQVLASRHEPEVFREYSEKSWTEFERGDFAWTAKARTRVWFPPVDGPIAGGLDRLQSACRRFCEVLDANLHAAAGSPPPSAMTPWLRWLPWEPKVTEVKLVADLSPQAVEVLRTQSGVPAAAPWPEKWLAATGETSALRVYRLRAFGSSIDVVVGFLSVARFRREEVPEIAAPSQALASAVGGIYDRWIAAAASPAPTRVFFTLGSLDPWPDNVSGLQGKDRLWIFSDWNEKGKEWNARMPEQGPADANALDFLERLKPVSWAGRIARIQQVIDAELDYGTGAPVHIEWLYEKLGRQFSRNAIAEGMFSLQDGGDYRLYWTNRKQLAIDRNRNRPEPMITRSAVGRRNW